MIYIAKFFSEYLRFRLDVAWRRLSVNSGFDEQLAHYYLVFRYRMIIDDRATSPQVDGM